MEIIYSSLLICSYSDHLCSKMIFIAILINNWYSHGYTVKHLYLLYQFCSWHLWLCLLVVTFKGDKLTESDSVDRFNSLAIVVCVFSLSEVLPAVNFSSSSWLVAISLYVDGCCEPSTSCLHDLQGLYNNKSFSKSNTNNF